MSRYIDADKVNEEIDTIQTSLESNDDKVWHKNKPYYKGLAMARSVINEQPTADVVEVVRCKDCAWWEARAYGSTIGRCESPCNGLRDEYVEDDDFCSYGKRKEGE